MRVVVILLWLAGVAAAQNPSAALLQARKELHAPPADHHSASERRKPDDTGIYDLRRLDIAFEVPETGLPEQLAFTVTLEAMAPIAETLPLLLVHSAVESVSLGAGAELAYEHIRETGELLIELPDGLDPGERVELSIIAVLDYTCVAGPSCTDEGDYAHLAEAGWYPMSLEFPASDRFRLRLDVTSRVDRHPSSVGGLEVNVGDAGDVTWRYRSEAPLSAIALAFGPDLPTFTGAEGLQFFGPNPSPTLRTLLASVRAAYTDLFGDYPFSRLAITAIPGSARSALGPQANVLVPLGLWAAPATPEATTLQREVISHEVGHQYFFNLVGVTGPTEAWLSEGFAEFAATRFSAIATGTLTHLRRNYWGYLTGVAPGAEAPVYGLAVRQGPHFFEIVYLKGSVVLWLLRATVGPDAFDEAMRAYVAAFTETISTTAEFIAHMEAHTERDLTVFFDRWLFRGGHPRLSVRTQRDGVSRDAVMIQISDQTSPPFAGTVPVVLRGVGPAAFVEVPIGGAARVRLGEGGWLDVDPDFTWLRRVRPDPPGDVNLDGVVDGMDLLDVYAAQGRQVPGVEWRDPVDVVRDGAIDEADLGAVMDAYGQGW